MVKERLQIGKASRKHDITVVKYTCYKKPNCPFPKVGREETNDLLWNALVDLFIAPERIHSLLTPSSPDDLESLKKQLAGIEKDEKAGKEKL